MWSRLFSKILSRPLWHLCTCRPHLECRAVANTCSALVSWQLSCHLQSLYMESVRSPPPPSKVPLYYRPFYLSFLLQYCTSYFTIWSNFLLACFMYFLTIVFWHITCAIYTVHLIVFTIIIILSILLLLYLLPTIHNDYLYIKKE